MDHILQEDLEQIMEASFIPWDLLREKTVLITGATGLIGYSVVNALLYANKERKLGVKVIALVRDSARAQKRFGAWRGQFGETLRFVIGTVEDLPFIEECVNYILHGASATASKAFVEQPVETIRTAVSGTQNLLEFAREKQAMGFVCLSSMEVYGHPKKGHKVTEDEIGSLSPLEARNSYPISKVACESLCHAYASEYQVPAKILRLTQTFGPGVNYDDNRIFAYFGRCVAEQTDIVLTTEGKTERSYLYTADAVTAILTVLLKGEPGQAYNAADENTYCSIAQMAEQIAKENHLTVRYKIADCQAEGYLEVIYMNLAVARLQELGWSVLGGGRSINEMIRRMMEGWRDR